MNLTIALAAVVAIAALAAWVGFRRAAHLRVANSNNGARLHSLPVYHAAYAAIWAALPALLLLAVWTPVQSNLVEQSVLASPEGRALPAFDMLRETIISEAREIAHGDREAGFNDESTTLAPRILEAESRYATVGGTVALLLTLGAAAFALRRRSPQFRARTGVERWLLAVLIAASLIAIL